jgi:hypothetical protein
MFAYSPRKDASNSATETSAVSVDRDHGQGIRWYTVDSANRLLPLVTRIASDLMKLAENAEQQTAQLHGIERLPRVSELRTFKEELENVKESLRADSEHVARVRAELASLGVEIDSLADGVFDFPALRDQRPVRLCWKLGEPEVAHWHEIGESSGNRQPL